MIIVSYAVVAILFLSTFFGIYFVSKNTFISYFDYNASVIADNISEKYDDSVAKRNTRVVNSILLNSNIQNNVKEIHNGDNSIDNRMIVRGQLANIMLDSDYLEDILIYIKNSNTIVCSSVMCTTNQYYTAYAAESFSTYDEFLAFLNEAEVPDNYYSQDSMQAFSRIQYNLYKEDVEIGKIILKNDIEGFLRPFVDENSDVVIIQNDYVIAASDAALANEILNTKYADSSFEINGKHVYKSSSSDGRRKCFYVVSMDKMNNAYNTYRFIVIIMSMICILLCIVVCIAFMYFHYIPIKKFSDFIKSRKKDKDVEFSYRLFSDAADYIETSEKYNEMKLDEREKSLREIYLEQYLVYKKNVAKESINILPGQLCALAVIKAVDYEQIFFEQVQGGNGHKLEMSNYILLNMFDEEFRKNFSDVVKCEINNMLVWLLVFDETFDWKKCIRDTAENILPIVKKEFNIQFECYKSDAHTTAENLSGDFDVIMIEIKQKTEKLPSETLGLIGAEEKKIIYHFPEAIKKQFYDSVEHGDAKSATIIIDNIIRNNEEYINEDINCLKALAAEIYNTTILKLSCFDVGVGRLFEENRLGKDIIMCNDRGRIEIELKQFIDYMCDFFLSKQNKNESVYVRARRFVYQNYKNPQLSSTIIANELGLSRDYFLTVFKKESGMKAADYIHRIRVEEACEILKKTSLSITEVAMLVGYSNSKTFSRVFAKVMGVTPGVYREKRN